MTDDRCTANHRKKGQVEGVYKIFEKEENFVRIPLAPAEFCSSTASSLGGLLLDGIRWVRKEFSNE